MNESAIVSFVFLGIILQFGFIFFVFRFVFKQVEKKFAAYKSESTFPQNFARVQSLRIGSSRYTGLVKVAVQNNKLLLKLPVIYPLAFPLMQIKDIVELRENFGFKYFQFRINEALPLMQIGIHKTELDKIPEFQKLLKNKAMDPRKEKASFAVSNTKVLNSHEVPIKDPHHKKSLGLSYMQFMYGLFIIAFGLGALIFVNTMIN